MKRTISTMGLNKIMDYEGFVNYPYPDSKGVFTIGIGHTRGVTPDTPNITREQGMKLLFEDLKPVEDYINKHFELKKQNQFDALCSLVFNEGVGRISKSNLYQVMLKDSNDRNVAYEWIEFCLDDGDFIPGLLTRRCKEIINYFS